MARPELLMAVIHMFMGSPLYCPAGNDLGHLDRDADVRMRCVIKANLEIVYIKKLK